MKVGERYGAIGKAGLDTGEPFTGVIKMIDKRLTFGVYIDDGERTEPFRAEDCFPLKTRSWLTTPADIACQGKY